MDVKKDQRQGSPSAQEHVRQQPPQIAWRLAIWLAVFLAIAWFWLNSVQQQFTQDLSYSEFKQKVESGEVASVTFEGDRLTGTFKTDTPAQERQPAPGAQERTAPEHSAEMFTTTLPPVEDPQLFALLQRHNVEVQAESQQTSVWTTVLITLLPWLVLLGVFIFLIRKMQQRMASTTGEGVFGFGKSKAKRFRRSETATSFNDVAGLENAKKDLREITSYLKDPEYFRKLGAKVPKGILLMGPPGTGKTMLAKAVAGEANVPFYSISGSEFIEMFVGVGASRVRDMFESAKKEAPAIIFIDEIDSVGRVRGTGLGGGHDEREQTLNQILGEMDGFAPHEAVVVLAATNRPDVLDPALLRPGRFDRKITMELPDRKARLAILNIHSKNVPLAEDVDLERLAALTPGFSGAYLENLVNEAALLAGRERKPRVEMAQMLAARDKVVLGTLSETVIDEVEKKTIAFHESGHAVAATLLPNADPLDKVTIIPRGHALGATEQIPVTERHNLPESYLRDRIGVMLGGRVAERLVFGEVTTGAQEDLKQATRLARHMVAHWGMSPKLGPVAYQRGEEHIFLGKEMTQAKDYSETTSRIIDEEVTDIIKQIERQVTQLLENHRPQLDALAETLMQKETLDAGEIEAIVKRPRNTPVRRRAEGG